VFDVLGRELATLVNEVRWPGEHSIQFDASGLAGGTYIYTLKTEKGSRSKRMLLIK
jgi:serine protease AprX